MRKLVIALFTIISWNNARAFQLTEDFRNGFYWSSLPIDFIVADTNADRLALITTLAQEAVTEWQSAVGDGIWNISARLGSPLSNRNIIRWSTNFGAETSLSELSTLAVAIRYTQGPYVARGEIIINGNHSINQQPELLKAVLVHELGHIMGLDHSEVPGAIMEAMLQIPYEGLHSDDIDGMVNNLEETQRRQLIGFVSPLARSGKTESTQSSGLACGTVELSGPGGGSGGSPMFSIGLGLLLALFLWRPKLMKRVA